MAPLVARRAPWLAQLEGIGVDVAARGAGAPHAAFRPSPESAFNGARNWPRVNE